MHLKDLGNLSNALSIYVKTGSLAGNVNTVLTASFKELNAAQILAKISTIKLTDAQKLEIVREYAVDKANYTTVESVRILSAAEKEAAASTLGLSAATRGLGVQLKSFAVAHPALLAITAIIAAIAIGYKIYDKLTVSLKEAKESLKDTSTELSSVKSELDQTQSKIKELENLDSLSITDKDDLQRLRDQNEELRIRQKYLEDEEVIKKRQVAQLAKENYYISQRGGVSKEDIKAYKDLYGAPPPTQEPYSYLKGESTPNPYISPGQQAQQHKILTGTNTVADLLGKYEYYSEAKKSALSSDDIQTADEYGKTLEETKAKLIAIRKELQEYRDEFSAGGDEFVTDLDNVNEKLNVIDSTLYTSGERLKDYLDDVNFSSQKEQLVTLASQGKLTANVLSTQFSDLDAFMKSNKLSLSDLIGLLKTYGTEVHDIKPPFTKEEMISAIDGLSEGFESLDKIMSSMKGKNPFDYALLDDKKFKDTFSTAGKEYTDFIEQISSSPKDIKACQGAFDNLVTAWLNSQDILSGLSDDTKQLTIDMLEQKGVANAGEIVTAALAEKHAQVAAQKFYNAKSSVALANNTIDEYGALLNEADAAQVSKEALAQLELSKIATNNVKIDTASDIDQVINLANAAGSSAEALGKLARAKSIFAQAESGSFNLNVPGNNLLLAEAENTVGKLGNGTFDYEFNIDPNKFKSATYGGGTKSNKSGGSGGSKDKSKEPTEFDWMSQKIKGIDSQVDKLQNKIDILVGYKGKNATTDTVIDRLIEKMSTLQQMYDKYMDEADKIGLSQDYINKIQNGSIEIESIGDEKLAKQIKDYQSLYDKAEDANKQIRDTQKKIDNLNLSKLDNIINQFKQLGDTQSKIIDTEKQFIALREKAGDEIYADDYADLIEQQGALIKNNADAYRTLKNEMSSMNLKQGSEEWKKYNDQLRDYQQNMISAADAVKEYMNAIVELKFKGLKDFKSQMDSIGNTISTMSDLIGGVGLTDDSGKLTDLGLAKMALYAQQLANAKQEAANYGEAINSLDDMLNDGLITQDEYNQRLYDYTSAQNSAISASKQAKDAILDLVKNGIQAEIDAKKKLVDETKAALDVEENLHNYQKSISEKQDNISKLERQIAALSNSTSRDDIAKRLQLLDELKKAQEDLNETQYGHEIAQRKDALDKQLEDFTESKDKEKEELDTNLDKQNDAINKYLTQVKDKYSTVYGVLTQYGNEYSMEAIKDLTNPWEEGGTAADLCGDAVGSAIANIQTSIDSLNLSPLYDLIDAFNSLGMTHGVGATGSMNFDDISDQGSWQKGKGGKDWFGEKYNPDGDYFYASDGIYTVNGKQYGFNDQGYMQKEWQKHDGNQYYFDANDGHMVKSQWIPGRDGSQYYLLADGTMAEDMAIKDKDGSYYYVDDAGKWDGKTLTAEQVRKLGYTIGYKRGTRNATKGWHLTDEDGVGSEGILTDRGVLRQFEGGEIVFNPEAMQNLYDIAQDPIRFIGGLNSIHSNMIDMSKVQPVHSISIDSPLVQIDGTGLSANEVAAIIKNETRDIDKRVSKSIKYELLGK